MLLGVEEVDDERRIPRSFPEPTPRRWHGTQVGGSLAEKGFGGRRSLESFVWAEHEVVGQSHLEPSFQVLDGQGSLESKARGVFERSPEALEAGGGEDVCRRAEAMEDAPPVAALVKAFPVNSPP